MEIKEGLENFLSGLETQDSNIKELLSLAFLSGCNFMVGEIITKVADSNKLIVETSRKTMLDMLSIVASCNNLAQDN